VRNIGLHLRFEDSFLDVVEHAALSGITSIQCFFMYSATGKRVEPTYQQIQKFKRLKRDYFHSLYVHGAYWINLADTARAYHPALRHEMLVAKKLGFSHLVLHPGAYPPTSNKEQGIDAIARSLDTITRHEKELTVVLENTAHGNRAIGSNIHDFGRILEKLEHPEKIRFCIDTAHAYAYGYDITNVNDRAAFITLIDRIIGTESVSLIHVNDSKTTCGSYMDHHAILDEGYIKSDALKALVLDERLLTASLILESPNIPFAQQVEMVNKVKQWHETPRKKIIKEQHYAHSD